MTSAPPATPPGRTRFETAMQVRPDDLDLNAHVHASRYFDYLLAARYDQMGQSGHSAARHPRRTNTAAPNPAG